MRSSLIIKKSSTSLFNRRKKLEYLSVKNVIDFIKNGKNPGYISYKADSPDYKNKLAYHYVMVYDNYLPVLDRFQEMVKAFLEE